MSPMFRAGFISSSTRFGKLNRSVALATEVSKIKAPCFIRENVWPWVRILLLRKYIAVCFVPLIFYKWNLIYYVQRLLVFLPNPIFLNKRLKTHRVIVYTVSTLSHHVSVYLNRFLSLINEYVISEFHFPLRLFVLAFIEVFEHCFFGPALFPIRRYSQTLFIFTIEHFLNISQHVRLLVLSDAFV